MNEKYYIAIAETGKLRALFTDEDLDDIEEMNGGNRNPYEIFSGSIPDERVETVYICELTSQGFIYTKKLNRNTLEEEDL